MLNKLTKRTDQKGFTLIEIALVMAIAALLLLIVFVALSGAQKSRRDTARKNDAARMLAAVESCASNNGGDYSQCIATPQSQIISKGYFSGKDPDGNPYQADNSVNPATDFIGVNATACPSSGGATASAAVYIHQEAGTAYCVDNH